MLLRRFRIILNAEVLTSVINMSIRKDHAPLVLCPKFLMNFLYQSDIQISCSNIHVSIIKQLSKTLTKCKMFF